MSNDEECAAMADDTGKVLSVAYLYDADFPKEIAAVRLVVERGDWLMIANGDDDTVEIRRTTEAELDQWSSTDASSFFPWAAAIGKQVQWSWPMENQRGYPDAVQFAFHSREGGGSVTVQLLATGSALRTSVVIPVETPLLQGLSA